MNGVIFFLISTSLFLSFNLAALQDLPQADGEASEKHWSVATCIRSPGVSINNDKLWDSLFVAASEVRISFIFAHIRDVMAGRGDKKNISGPFF